MEQRIEPRRPDLTRQALPQREIDEISIVLGQRKSQSLIRRATRAGWGVALAGALLAVVGFAPSAFAILGMGTSSSNTLNVATWGGAYGKSQEIAFFEPFVKETGTVIATETYDGSLAKLKGMIDGNGKAIDLVDVSGGMLDTLCSDGLLEKIDVSSLGAAAQAESLKADFLDGGLSDCGVAGVAWSMAIAYDRQAFRKNAPTGISALLDTARFPGVRALPKDARYTLELALLADGVPPESVYTELGTEEGVNRAFAALDKIKDSVMFWAEADQPITWLLEKKASMVAGYSGRIFRAAVGDPQIGVIWDGQIYDIDAWAIPTTAKNKEEALKFIGFAIEPARLAAQAQLIAYGPLRKSAIELVGKHPVVGVEMQAYLPTSPENFGKALKFDETWWAAHGDALSKRFDTWQAQVQAAADAKEAARKAKEAASKEPVSKAEP